jgi:hypothetical protein
MRFTLLGSLLACFLTGSLAASAPSSPAISVQTGPFAQRMSERYTTAHGLPGTKVTELRIYGGKIWARTDRGGAVFADGKWRAAAIPEKETPAPAVADPARLPAGAVVKSAARTSDGRVFVITDVGSFRSNGRSGPYVPLTTPTSYLTRQPIVDVDAQPSCVAVDPAGVVWVGSDRGVFGTDGKDYWTVVDRKAGLPFETVTCLAFGSGSDMWVGTTEGVCRFAGGRWQYYWGPRWLPGNHVNDLLVTDAGTWVATDGGVARLHDEELTLARKADHYQRITQSRHSRRGFISGCRFRQAGNPDGGHVLEASDNDGLWTAVYVAAQSFRYAVTKSAGARAEARKSMSALLDLVKYTGIPGYPARALKLKDEEADGYNPEETVRVVGEKDKIWFNSPVDPNVLCKGDTSSDELDGHYFAWSIYHDLVADEAEKRAIRSAVAAVTDNILAHDYTLVGHTGRKTRWAVFGPKFLNDDPNWWEERGLNSLEMLAYLKVAEQITSDGKYARAARALIEQHHYLLNLVTQKVAYSWDRVNHSDDQMAFMLYYIFLTREKDPAVRRVLLQSLERSWQIERPERSPFFNFVYGVGSGRACDVEAAVGELQEWPWELIEWQGRGSHRHDVEVRSRTVGARTRRELTRALPASERALMRWNGNPYGADGGSPNGASEDCGSAWLMPYWLGRYHGLIRE